MAPATQASVATYAKDEKVLCFHHELLYEALDIIKRSYKPGPSLKKWAEEAGYVNITEDILPVPMGLWPKDKKLVY